MTRILRFPIGMFLLPLLAVSGLRGSTPEGGKPLKEGTVSWILVERGDSEKEILWVEEGGRIEFARTSRDRILELRSGRMPPARFRQLWQRMADSGPTESAGRAAGGRAGEDSCLLSGFSGGSLWALDCRPVGGPDPGSSRLAAEFLGLSVGLQEAGDFGTYLRLGPAESVPPPGLEIPEGLRTLGNGGADPSDPLVRLARGFLARPGKLRFSGEVPDWNLLDRLPTDRSGKRWLPDGDRWRPVNLFTYDPDPS